MFECQYCGTQFVKEDNYSKHKCREMERTMEMRTPKGMRSYKLYKKWFKIRKLVVPEVESFISSKYYGVFFTFSKFVKEMGIPDVDLYIQFMVQENIVPSHWSNPDIYDYFMKHFDNNVSPITHVKITLSSLDRLANVLECELRDVFKYIKVGDIVNLIQSRNLSPWCLLLSNEFKSYLVNEVTLGERQLIEDVIKVDQWKIIFERKRNCIPQILEILEKISL